MLRLGRISEPWHELWSPTLPRAVDDPRASLATVQAALSAWRGVVRPLAGEAELSEHDPRRRGEGPRPVARFAARDLPPEHGVAAAADGELPEDPDAAALVAWLAAAMDRAPLSRPAWLTWTAQVTAARLGPAPVDDVRVGGVAVPTRRIAGATWVAGPWAGARQPPVALRLTGWSDRVQVQWRVGWSAWARGGSGAPGVARAVQALRDEGWGAFAAR